MTYRRWLIQPWRIWKCWWHDSLSPERARLAAFSVLIGLVFWNPPTAGAASESLTQAAEGQGLYAERCRGNGASGEAGQLVTLKVNE